MSLLRTNAEPDDRIGPWTAFREAPTAIKAIFAGVFINRLGGLLNIFLVLFLTEKGYSVEQATLALGAYGAGSVVGVLIGGSLADRLGVRAATVVSMAGSGVLLATLLYLPNFPLILVTVALVTMVSQMYRPASSALLAKMTPKSRLIMTMGIYRFGLNLGTAAAPLIGFALYNLNDNQYTLLFWADATVALVYAVVAFFALPPREPKVSRPESAAAPKASYAAVLADRRFVLYLVATFLNGVVYIQYLSTLPLDVSAHNLAIFWYSAAVSLNGILVIAFELLVTKISQTWPMRLTVGLTFLLLGAGVAVYGLPLGPAVIIIGTLIWTLAEIVGGPAVFSYPAMAGPAHLKGRYIGSFQFMFGLGTAAGPLIGGMLFAQLGHAMWPVLALGTVVAAVLGVVAIRTPRPTPTVWTATAHAASAGREPEVSRPAPDRPSARLAPVHRLPGRSAARGNQRVPLVELRLFVLRPGTRDRFQQLGDERAVPLMRRLGINVLAHGPVADDADLYYLVRAFDSEAEREEQSRALHGTCGWKLDIGVRALEMIKSYRIATVRGGPAIVPALTASPHTELRRSA
jgi:MFS family permease